MRDAGERVPIEPRPGKWLVKPGKRRVRFFDIAWVWSVVIWGGLFASHLFRGISDLVFQIIGTTWLVTLVICAIGLPVREALVRRRSRRDRAFSDGAAIHAEAAVEIVIECGSKAIGADRGVIWFDRGLIGFSGERTSFLLAYGDFDWREGTWMLTKADVPYLPLRLKAGDGKAKVSVRPMWGQGGRYRGGLRKFIAEKTEPVGERQWPPLTREVAIPALDSDPSKLTVPRS